MAKCYLLELPDETLCNIISFVGKTPTSTTADTSSDLSRLSRVSKRLRRLTEAPLYHDIELRTRFTKQDPDIFWKFSHSVAIRSSMVKSLSLDVTMSTEHYVDCQCLYCTQGPLLDLSFLYHLNNLSRLVCVIGDPSQSSMSSLKRIFEVSAHVLPALEYCESLAPRIHLEAFMVTQHRSSRLYRKR